MTSTQLKDFEIDFEASYDLDNNHDFCDNFSRIEDSLYLYINFGNIEDDINTEDLCRIKSSNKKSELTEACDYFEIYYEDHYTKDELVSVIYSDLEISEALGRSWGRDKTLDDIIDCTLKFEIITSRGYSQGDIVDVIVLHSLAKVWSMPKKQLYLECEGDLKVEIGHYMWDSLITGSLSVEFKYPVFTANVFDINQEATMMPHKVRINYAEIFEILFDSYEMKINSDIVIRHLENQMKVPLENSSKKEICSVLEEFDYKDVDYPCACA